MITIVSLWEYGWLEPNVEAFMWKQLVKAYGVDEVIFSPERLENRLFPKQTDTMENALDMAKGEKVFLIPEEGEDLETFVHPEDAVYVFGNAMQGNHSIAENSKKVYINTPKNIDFFAVNAAAIVLYDRSLKNVG